MVGSHSRSFQLIRSLLSYTVPPLHSNELLGLPGNAEVKVRKMLKSASWRAKDPVGESLNLSAIPT
ncbi:hypothetical protein H5410_057079 [Solanum commersonii]|uniref:Uncharacterized protein n=1 Tax=Solanum commersonii TaxID=4109 RepID=A0A9J5WM01_SOLCO|nr:hypothetical protein H5410_057079 [Solanum commersonii]